MPNHYLCRRFMIRLEKERCGKGICCSNLVCDNLRIDNNTSPHPFLCTDVSRYSVVLRSQFGSIRAFAKVLISEDNTKQKMKFFVFIVTLLSKEIFP